MMEMKDILEQGLLEKYLLDELSTEEAQRIESALATNQELRTHFQLLEADFEKMAFENAIPPPAHVKSALVNRLPASEVRSMPSSWLWIAASFVGVFLLSSLFMYTKWQSAQNELDFLEQQSTVLQDRLELLEENYKLTNNRLQIINNPSTIPFVLTGNEKTPNSRAVAYVNHENRLVVVNPKGLPPLPADQTYQMWSDVEGEMINMGLLPTDKDLVTLKYIDHAESLNITIEPAGGNDHPTVEQLISAVTLL